MALAGTVVWEVRTTGNNANGGGFDPGVGSPGTDYSQQDSAQFNFTDLASTNGTNASPQVTSASHNFVAADVGNLIHISAGTNWTAGWYTIVSATANAATLDRACGSAASLSGGTWYEGGALASIAQMVTNITAAGATAYVKATANYTLSSAQAISVAVSGGGAINIIGYTSTRGDGGRATITTATNSINLFEMNGADGWVFTNFIFSSTAGTPGDGWHAKTSSAKHMSAVNCKFTGFANAINGNYAVDYAFNSLALANCDLSSNTIGVINSGIITLWGCYIHDNTSDGVKTSLGTYNYGPIFASRTIFKSNGGSGVNFTSSTQTIQDGRFINCAFINNTAAGISYVTLENLYIFNCIFDSNGTYAIHSTNSPAVLPSTLITNSNAYGSGALANVSGNFDSGTIKNGPGDVTTLSVDPFVSRAGANFALNNSANGGALLRGAGFPGALTIGGTGYEDIGPLQHQDSPASVIVQRQTVYLSEEGALI